METPALLLFSVTVLPLICTPGPDMLFIAAQAISAGVRGGLRATTGVCLGYLVHSALVALGLAAVVAASPNLFAALRWIGMTYLVYLACRLIRSALSKRCVAQAACTGKNQLKQGFLTSLMNPKGMMIYVAILPQFIDPNNSVPIQATILSATFVFWCALVYTILSFSLGNVGSRTNFTDAHRRKIEGGSGVLLLVAAGVMGTR
jgi:threonine/homoserine/homoserine lactone efflux protein